MVIPRVKFIENPNSIPLPTDKHTRHPENENESFFHVSIQVWIHRHEASVLERAFESQHLRARVREGLVLSSF